jgi:hypothetical protein
VVWDRVVCGRVFFFGVSLEGSADAIYKIVNPIMRGCHVMDARKDETGVSMRVFEVM